MSRGFTADYEAGDRPGTWVYVIYTPDGEENCHGARTCSKQEIEFHLAKVCKRANADIGKSGNSWRANAGHWSINPEKSRHAS